MMGGDVLLYGPSRLRALPHLQSWRPYRLVKIRSSSFSEPNEVFLGAVWGDRRSGGPAELRDHEGLGQNFHFLGSFYIGGAGLQRGRGFKVFEASQLPTTTYISASSLEVTKLNIP